MKKLSFPLLTLMLALSACQQNSGGSRTQEPVQNVAVPAEPEKTTDSAQENSPRDLRPILKVLNHGNSLSISIQTQSTDVEIISVARYEERTTRMVSRDGTSRYSFSDTVETDPYDLTPWDFRYVVHTTAGEFVYSVKEYKDLIIDGPQTLDSYKFNSQSVELRRLILTRNAVLSTEGKNVSIHAQNFAAESGAIIETLSEKTAAIPAPPQMRGRSGGALNLQADTANGHVRFVLRGGKGGQGGVGESVSETERGTPGAKGADAIYHLAVRGNPRADSPGIDAWCEREAKDGAKGGKGKTGGIGGTGAPGGDSGYVYLSYPAQSPFTFTFESHPGDGGDGGLGGQGGPGGIGGEPGRSDKICSRAAKPGAEGDHGDQGPRGLKGAEGFAGGVCVKIGNDFQCVK